MAVFLEHTGSLYITLQGKDKIKEINYKLKENKNNLQNDVQSLS